MRDNYNGFIFSFDLKSQSQKKSQNQEQLTPPDPPTLRRGDPVGKDQLSLVSSQPLEGTIIGPTAIDFDSFWGCAVRREGKGAARKAYVRACAIADVLTIMNAWKLANSIWATWPKDRRRYIPHPSTWLNGERWDDDPPTANEGFTGPRPGESNEEYEARVFGPWYGLQ